MFFVIFIVCLVFGFISMMIYDRAMGFFLGFFLGPIGLIISAILSLNPDYRQQKKKEDELHRQSVEKFNKEREERWQAKLRERDEQWKKKLIEKTNKKEITIGRMIGRAIGKLFGKKVIDQDEYWNKLKESGKAWH